MNSVAAFTTTRNRERRLQVAGGSRASSRGCLTAPVLHTGILAEGDLSKCIHAGFGVTAKSTSDCRKMEPSGVVVFHQSDVGEYLRSEDDL